MFSFVIKRLLQAILVMLIVTMIAFLLFQFVGDPVTQMLGQEATEADRLALTHELGLDQPIWKQFGAFIANTLHGDFGMSLRQGTPVVDLFKEKMPATLELAFFSAMVATFMGIPLGVFVALKKNSIWASWLMGLSLVGISLPTFFIGILLILVFSVWLGWLPSYGRGETVAFGWWTTGLLTGDGLKHIILPAVTLAIFQIALVMRLVRSEMLEVMRTDYIRFARARGVPKRKIFLCVEKYAAAGDYDHGTPDRRHHRLFDRDRNRFPVAGYGSAVYTGGSVCRYSGHGSLPLSNFSNFCRHQPHC